MKAETLEELREYVFREGSDEDPLSIEVGALIKAYDKLAGRIRDFEKAILAVQSDRGAGHLSTETIDAIDVALNGKKA